MWALIILHWGQCKFLVWGRDFCIIDVWKYYFHSTHLFSFYSSLNDFGVSMLHILLFFFSFLSHYFFSHLSQIIYIYFYSIILFHHSHFIFHFSYYYIHLSHFLSFLPFLHSYLLLILHHYWWLIHLKSVHDLMANLPTLWGFEPMSNHFALIIFLLCEYQS